MINKIKDLITDHIFFITPDVKIGMGLENILPNYHIICSYGDPIIPILRRQGAKIFCLAENIGKNEKLINNSGMLLEHPLIIDYIKKHSKETPWIIYFKPSLKLDLLTRKMGFLPIGNKAELNDSFENKINFYKLTQKYLSQFTIPAQVGILGQFNYEKLKPELGLPFVIQFGRGWAGKTTFFINDEKEFNKVAQKFPSTLIKLSRYIDGLTFLNNCCIYKDSVLVSPPAIQLSGIKKLHQKSSVTCGRQWPAKFLSKKQTEVIFNISHKVGELMKEKDFRGFFGLDFLVESSSGKIYLSEVNARLTASASFYTYLEKGLGSIPLLVYHIASFLEKDITENERSISDVAGSQVIFRSQACKAKFPASCDFGVFRSENEKPHLVGKDYHLEELATNEFIYMERTLRDTKTIGEEIARIETKREVLEVPGRLRSWIESLIWNFTNIC